MRKLKIRYAGVGDIRELAALGRKTFRDTYYRNPNVKRSNMIAYMETSFSEAQISKEIADKDTVFLIAEADQASAGYAKLVTGRALKEVGGKSPMEISRIYLRKEFIGKGYGRRLLDTCIDEAERAGCDVVWLSVWQHNHHAIRFYERNGLCRAGTHFFDLAGSRETDLVMSKSLGNRTKTEGR